jgi:aminoglycoside phosphotransferase (APT) family kinase protein
VQSCPGDRENRVSDVIVAPQTRDLGILAENLRHWVAARMPGARDLQIVNLAYPRGAGQSHETVLFDAEWTQDGERRAQGCVVRIKPASFTVFPDNLFDEQYQVMKALSEGDQVRVARPLWFEEDPALLGQPFFVMEKKLGRVPVSIPHYSRTGFVHEASPEQRRRLWDGAVRQLAAVQLVPLEGLEFLEGPAHAPRGLAQEWDKYERFVAWLRSEDAASWSRFGALLEAGLARLKSLWPENQPEGLVWGDARIGNMMFDDDFDVVAVMDWEQPSLGGALHDLAWFTVVSETMHGHSSQVGQHLEGLGTREETIALWQQVCGKSVDDLEWYEDFTHLKMSCTAVRLGQLRGSYMIDEAALIGRLKLG